MKKFLFGMLCLAFAFPVLAQDNNDEFRATWVVTWEHSSSIYTPDQGKARIREIMDDHENGNFNAVLWQARQGGTSYYNSSFEPWGPYLGGSDPGYDPLAYAVEEGHKRGMEVHAWFNVFQASSTTPGAPAAEHPEWICRDGNGNPMPQSIALSPGLEEVREYTINVAMEIVQNYDIDGLHLDYIRWNEYDNSDFSQNFARRAEENPQKFDGMISEEQLEHLLDVSDQDRYLYDVNHPYSVGIPDGFGSWEEWWRWSVTEFVSALRDSIQQVKPWVRLSVAALGNYRWGGWQGYSTVYQDAALWFNQGYIDQLTPMHYHWTTPDDFYGMLTGSGSDNWEYWITSGINDGRLYSVGPGSYILAEQNRWGRHPAIIDRVRDVSWTDGFQFFRYGFWEEYNYFDESAGTFFQKKTKIRDTGLVSDQTPTAPSMGLTKLDSLNYEIEITPPGDVTAPQWFVIYRSPDATLDMDADEIIKIAYGDTGFSYIDVFNGLQDFNGSYTYFATRLDRYWNESPISNWEESDPIPSFAPTVVETTPANGETVPVNTDMVLTFSKTVNTESVEQAMSFSPDPGVVTYAWNTENTTLTVIPEEYLSYDTEYTVTVDASATDINGRPLDGNGDGQGGDAYSFSFSTSAVDNVPPQVIYSSPDYQTHEEGVEVGEVVTFAFDEEIDESSVNITLEYSNRTIDFDYIHTIVGNKSILGIQPLEDFFQASEYTVTIDGALSDTLGNAIGSDIVCTFTTSSERYVEVNMIDSFNPPGEWWQPSGSGSTTGIVAPNTTFGYTRDNGIPAVAYRKSAYLNYEWEADASAYLLREYLSGGAPREVEFDTSYTMQVYIYGDASMNKFRFAVDDGDGFGGHEVSEWQTIDWYGWKLVEWDLSDTSSIGVWIGNGELNPPMRVDSYQLTYDTEEGAISGRIHFDEFRVVKKTTAGSAVDDEYTVPTQFTLEQNYPNPFNPVTNIRFTLPTSGEVHLAVYNLSGQTVKVLQSGQMDQGTHVVPFDGSDLSSGVYFYRLRFNEQQTTRRMALIK